MTLGAAAGNCPKIFRLLLYDTCSEDMTPHTTASVTVGGRLKTASTLRASATESPILYFLSSTSTSLSFIFENSKRSAMDLF
jgi:hypothetical protein